MSKIFTLSLLFFISFSSFAVIHDVEVGGSPFQPNNLPYYEPQFLTIQAGDIVRWTWVLGEHSVTSQSGPESFDSGELESPNEFEFEFTMPGNYDFECTVGQHAQWQFGTITVEIVNSVDQYESPEFNMYPVPMDQSLTVEVLASQPYSIGLIDLTGKYIFREEKYSGSLFTFNRDNIPGGVYFIEVELNGIITRKKLLLR